MREQSFSKNVTLKTGNIEIITGFMNKTKKNFSATLNIIIKQWDEISVMLMKQLEDKQIQTEIKQFDEIKEAKAIDHVKGKNIIDPAVKIEKKKKIKRVKK